MKYQEDKISNTINIAIFFVLCGVALIVMLFFRTYLEPGINSMFRGSPYWSFVASIILVMSMFAITGIYDLLTSPKQNSAHLDWMIRHLRFKLPPDYDATLLDANYSAYHLSTLSYWRQKRRSDHL